MFGVDHGDIGRERWRICQFIWELIQAQHQIQFGHQEYETISLLMSTTLHQHDHVHLNRISLTLLFSFFRNTGISFRFQPEKE